MPADYQTGKVYKITSPHTDQVYIGSTTRSLSARFNDHVSRSKKSDLHNASKIVIVAGNPSIELIEAFPCTSRKELERREGELQKMAANCCNKVIAGRTYTEYRADHKEERAVRRRAYRDKNRDKIRENDRLAYHKKKADAAALAQKSNAIAK